MHYLHFEGLDLAGKSTVCRNLRDYTDGGWQIRGNAMCDDNEIFQLADRLRKVRRLLKMLLLKH